MNTKVPSVALVCLTFNEIDGVRALLPELVKLDRLDVDEILAVDGGSTDGTLGEFARFGVRVVTQQAKGRGEAMRLAAEATNCDYVVFFSPDGNEDWRDIPKFRPLFIQGYDMVIASRMMSGAKNEEDDRLLRPRKWANNAFNLTANMLFRREGPFITDTINGFRGMRRGLFAELGVDAVGYTIEYQTSMRALRAKKKIFEFPTVEGQRIGGETKAPSIPTGLRFVRCVVEEVSPWSRH